MFLFLPGCIDCTQRILGDDAVQIGLHTRSGHAPLHLAAKHGDVRLVRMLITRGANVGEHTLDGYTPFLLARLLGQHRVVKHLLTVDGVDPNARPADGSTGLMLAISGSQNKVAARLLICPSKAVENRQTAQE
jgi:ankyrin repeat protein